MPPAGSDSSAIVFAIVPHVLDELARRDFADLCGLLGEDLRRAVTPRCAESPTELAHLLETCAVDFAWISPTLALMSPGLAGIVPLLSSMRQGVALFHSVLFTAVASPITSVDELSGARAAWVAPTSASGYIVPRLSLVRRGLDLRRAFAHEAFCNSHGGVAWAVHRGEADVGATYAVFEGCDPDQPLLKAGFFDFVPKVEARVLDVAGPIPADMIVANRNVAKQDCSLFGAALSRLAEEPVGSRSVQRVIGADAFRPILSESLDALDELVTAARSLDPR